MGDEIDKLRDCPVLTAIDAIGGKWRPRILWRLRDGPAHFGELHRTIGVSEKVLAENLRALERHGIVARTLVMLGAVKTAEYSFTPYGRTLAPVLDAMGAWGLQHATRHDMRA